MVAKSKILDQTAVDDTAANCLMLLSRVGLGGGGEKGESESRVYRCKTCMKEFTSFQALGGHRASHTKPNNNNSRSDDKSSSSSSISSSGSVTKKAKTPTSHRCPICGLDFPIGQALGGHMRKHRNEKVSGELVTRSLFPEETTTMVTTLKKSSSGKRVACLDLVLDSKETLNLNLELGMSIY